ncbi:hypothetical protein [Kribbella sp. NPDC051718]|uniref:hypothetical protein n=1 Tax=Kribbella sp. NPDC051718 TaxID=3155168 RepID=UPI0034493943
MSGRPIAAAVAALLALTITPGAARASGTEASGQATATAACAIGLGSVTAGGDHTASGIIAGSPPTVQEGRTFTDIYPDGQVRLSSMIAIDPDVTGTGGVYSGFVVMGSTMYNTGFVLTEDGEVDRSRPTVSRVGGGWGDTTFFETSTYWVQPRPFTSTHYALRADGTLTRWENHYDSTNPARLWINKRSATGFAAVKTMALISQTPTYETFLANTRGGALYTIRLPRTSPLKPIVKKVRSSTWQGFEALIAEKCGQYGTLLLGIDKDTHSGYLYAVGHANGSATVIQGLGKVPDTFTDPVYFRHALRPGDAPILFGE